MFFYAQIYWLAEFRDVSCLQFNYLRVETLTPTWDTLTITLTPTWEDFVGPFCRNIYNNIHEYNILTCSTHVFNALEVNINMSLCTRDNRCQRPFTCCRQLPVYDIGCVCSFTCLPNVGRTNPDK
jgi:hypothetical protein